jgi:hypothetical protein
MNSDSTPEGRNKTNVSDNVGDVCLSASVEEGQINQG